MFDLIAFIKIAGCLGVGGLIFAETGLLVGFFLPGDSLLFTAGLLASQGYLNIFLLVTVTFFAAVIGDSVGYMIGKKTGPKIFTKKDSFWFNPEQVTYAHAFFKKHGGKTIILARFLPVIRTIVPVIAGVGKMEYKAFLFNNVIGALLWAVGITLTSFFLGKVIPNIDQYLLPIIILIIIVSIAPTVIHILKDKNQRKQMIILLKRAFGSK